MGEVPTHSAGSPRAALQGPANRRAAHRNRDATLSAVGVERRLIACSDFVAVQRPNDRVVSGPAARRRTERP